MCDPSHPESYPERILALVIGKTPQIITETVYALAVLRQPPFVPTRVEVLTTSEGASNAKLALLHPDYNRFVRLCADYGLTGKIKFDESCIHCIEGADGQPIPDIRTPEENACAANAITSFVYRLTAQENCAVHVSIAGGRKTMGFYMGYALSLFGRMQDRMSHVLVSPPFEGSYEFFYPPAKSEVFKVREEGVEHLVNSDSAQIMLAEIPFVPMRHSLVKDLVPHSTIKELIYGQNFNVVVERARLIFGPPLLEIRFDDHVIVCGGKEVRLDKQLFAFYAWLAMRCKRGEGHIRYSDERMMEFLDVYRRAVGSLSGDYEITEQNFRLPGKAGEEKKKEFFQEKKSRINSQLKAQLKGNADPYLIESSGKRKFTRFGLNLEPGQIKSELLQIKQTRF